MYEYRPDETNSESQAQNEHADGYESPVFDTANDDAERIDTPNTRLEADNFVHQAAQSLDLPEELQGDVPTDQAGVIESEAATIPKTIETPDEITAAQLPDYRRRLTFPEARFIELTRAIDGHPDAPVNYVLRGELLLDAGDAVAAADDFATAILLAEQCAERAEWGYLSVALIERAHMGLRRCKE